MSNPHQLYTNGTDIFRISKYVPPTESVKGCLILSRGESGCEVTLDEFLTNWKVFNARAAFADYLLYSEQMLASCKDTDLHNTFKHTMQWVKGRSVDVGCMWATPIKLSDLEHCMFNVAVSN